MLTFGQKPQAPQRVPLARGVALHVRPLDSRAHTRIFRFIAREMNALVEGRKTGRDWGFEEAELAAIIDDEDARTAATHYMRAVLVAEAAAVSIEGVLDPETDAPAQPSFALFLWLFADTGMDAMWRLQIAQTEALWVDEGNVSGRAPAGDGATAAPTAADVAPSTSPAPMADGSTATTEDRVSGARSTPTRPGPMKATPPGASAPAPSGGTQD